jgi:hypothetical protein
VTRREFRDLYLRERRAFAARFPRVVNVGLGLTSARYTPGSPRGFRDVAWCEPSRGMIWFCERALRDMSRANLVALIRHELGHCADPALWRKGREKRADVYARAARGAPIRYDARDVQTLGRGIVVRPAYLHQ